MKFLRQITTKVLILVFFINTNLWSKSAPESFADLAEELMPSVVNISTTQTVKTHANPFPFQFPPGSPFGEMFKVTTFGESHGPALGCVIDGCPPGLKISEDEIQAELDRGSLGPANSPRKEGSLTPLRSYRVFLRVEPRELL